MPPRDDTRSAACEQRQTPNSHDFEIAASVFWMGGWAVGIVTGFLIGWALL